MSQSELSKTSLNELINAISVTKGTASDFSDREEMLERLEHAQKCLVSAQRERDVVLEWLNRHTKGEINATESLSDTAS